LSVEYEKGDLDMSLEAFFRNVMESNRDELQQIVELERLLDEVLLPKENSQIYVFSVTSNW